MGKVFYEGLSEDDKRERLFKRLKYIENKNEDQSEKQLDAKPLKHLRNFWKNLNIPLINCEVELILTWSKNCVLADMTVNSDADPAIVAPSVAKFKITGTKLYVPVVTLSK